MGNCGNGGSELLFTADHYAAADAAMTAADRANEAADRILSSIGNDGYSAYELWLQQGNTGTVQDFLDSLKGADGIDKNFIHVQNSPSNKWIMPHDLNKIVSVFILDTAGSEMEGVITKNDGTVVIIEFNIPVEGSGILN